MESNTCVSSDETQFLIAQSISDVKDEQYIEKETGSESRKREKKEKHVQDGEDEIEDSLSVSPHATMFAVDEAEKLQDERKRSRERQFDTRSI